MRCSVWCVGVSVIALAHPSLTIAADSLEDGVADLAQQIVSKSAASDRRTLAVSAFPHADDTCSELSNYLVDELVLSLFDVGDGRLQIIERSQLERIFAELELSMSGAIDANTTKELGRIYGVDSLLIGSVTVLGDRLRVISRLIETETGQVFSAAATNIPKTATIVSLMERPAAAGCTMAPQSSSHPATNSSDRAPDTPALIIPVARSMERLVGEWKGMAECDGQALKMIFKAEEVFGLGVSGTIDIGTATGDVAYMTHETGNIDIPAVLTISVEARTSSSEFFKRSTLDMQLLDDGRLVGTARGDKCKSIVLARN
jgi:TolB-like protein